MRHDEITRMVTGSAPDDWVILRAGPLYMDSLAECQDGEGRRWLEVSSHYYLAVYKADVSLRLAWGLTLHDKLVFEGWTWPDRSIERMVADAFWQGALVARWTVLLVDGANGVLPDPDPAYVKTDDSLEGYQLTGWTAKASEIALARLLDGLMHPADNFERYFEAAGVIEVPDE